MPVIPSSHTCSTMQFNVQPSVIDLIMCTFVLPTVQCLNLKLLIVVETFHN